MDRAETIRLLRALYQDGGQSALTAICDDIRERGPLHDPEWLTCQDCGVEFEPEQLVATNQRTRHQLRCPECWLHEKNVAAVRRHRRNLRGDAA